MDSKKRVRTIGIIGGILLIVLFVVYFSSINNKDDNKQYFNSLSYSQLMEKIKDKDDFVLCVTSTTCSHCASYKPTLEDVANEYKIQIYYTDVDLYSDDEREQIKNDYFVGNTTPITLFFNDGKEESVMTRLEGNVSKDKLLSNLQKHGFIDSENS